MHKHAKKPVFHVCTSPFLFLLGKWKTQCADRSPAPSRSYTMTDYADSYMLINLPNDRLTT